MNRKFATRLIPFAVCSLALIGNVTAQQQQNNPPIAGKSTIGVTVAEAELVAPGYRASKLLHADIYNDMNQKIGKVDDLVIAPDGKLSVAVIDVGGFLGVGKHRVAIPVQQFSQIGPKRITLPGATKEALKQMPEFEYAKA